MFCVRDASNLDRDRIRDVYLRAFSDDESNLVSALAVDLLSLDTEPRSLSLVAEADGSVVAHVAASPVQIAGDKSPRAYILSPLAVTPEFQKRGIGTGLIEGLKDRLTRMGIDVLFVYGDPAYYGRFGFSADAAAGYVPPYELSFPVGWLAVGLNGFNCELSAGEVSCVPPLCDPALW